MKHLNFVLIILTLHAAGNLGSTISKRQSEEACDCVEPYLCENGRIKTDGTGIITWRAATKPCAKHEVCCLLPEGEELAKDSNEKEPSEIQPNQNDDSFADDDNNDDDDFEGSDEPSAEQGGGKWPSREPEDGDPVPVAPPENPVVEDVDETNPDPEKESSVFVCGMRKQIVTLKVSGDSEDTETGPGDFPWTLLIKYQLNDIDGSGTSQQAFLCGASLVHPSVVLTAAHCIERKEKENLIVRAGEWDLRSESEPGFHQDRKVQKVIIHPKYEQLPIRYDIAILVLDQPITKNEVINTVCMPHESITLDRHHCYATGWGAQSDDYPPEGDHTLRKAKLRLLDRGECEGKLRQTKLGPRFNLHKSFNCAGGDDETDTCKGDGGGPLACMANEPPHHFYLAGITSWGVGCGRKGIPGVYTDIDFMKSWINDEAQALVEQGLIST